MNVLQQKACEKEKYWEAGSRVFYPCFGQMTQMDVCDPCLSNRPSLAPVSADCVGGQDWALAIRVILRGYLCSSVDHAQ